jgi:L-threonylcarbamoyladenylate synthase
MVAAAIPCAAMKCMEKFWPGPLTIVLPKKDDIPDIVTAGLATVAIRMPLHPVALRLIELAGVPVAAPSANPFGYLSPTTAQHVAMQLGNKVAMILDGGKCAVGVESTIIKIENDEINVLRYGGISVEEIERTTGLVVTSHATTIEAPGQLPYHYAPQTKIVLVSDIMSVPDDATSGLLLFKKRDIPYTSIHIMYLSDDGDMRQAAGNLFSCLHALDAMKLKVIYAEQVEEVGLGRAIMDRLKKAQARFM